MEVPTHTNELHAAVASGSLATVSRLLAARADPSAEADDRTPLHLAAYSGHQIPCLILLNMHASASLVDKNGRNAVLAAVSAGRKDLARNIEDEVRRLQI